MRSASTERRTKETEIFIALHLDGGEISVQTGIGFFDHMLTAFALHGAFGLTVKACGDLQVDCHHTVEDTGIVLGQTFAKALTDKAGIARYGSFYVPMDEALGFASVDVSGRPYLVFDAAFPQPAANSFDFCMVQEFFRAFAFHAGITLHIKALYGNNSHHIAEALFKACAHAMRLAVQKDGRAPLSTKGAFD